MKSVNFEAPHNLQPSLLPLLGPNVLSIMFSNDLILCTSLGVRDQDFHPYKTRDKSIFLCFVLIRPTFLYKETVRRFRVISTPVSYSGGLECKSEPGDRRPD